MLIGGTGGGWSPLARSFGSSLRIASFGGAAPTADPAARPTSLSALRGLADDVKALDEALGQLERLDRTTSSSRARTAVARGSLSLAEVNDPSTAASVRSTEEVNTIPTSYSTREPEWTGASAAAATLDGIYDGSQGDDTLDFEVTLVPVLGIGNVEIEVRDGAGDPVETLTFAGNGGAQTRTLSNGLELSLDSTDVSLRDSFSIDVFSSIGREVQPDSAFNGTGDSGPEFDPGQGVTAGSFTVNGVAISVALDDSLNDVLARITASEAGVIAQMDRATESVVLTQKTTGSAESLELGADTSGFLDAVKLSGATVTAGTDGRDREGTSDVIANVEALQGVTSGSFMVDGQSIEIDVSVDSVEDVLGRITAATDVRATISSSGEVLLTGRGRLPFEVTEDETNLFAALGIVLQTYSGRGGKKSVSLANKEGVRSSIVKVTDAFNSLLRGSTDGVPDALVNEIRSRLTTAVGGVFSSQLGVSGSSTLRSGLGVNLSKFDESNTRSMELDAGKLSQALRTKDSPLIGLLFGSKDGAKGIVETLQTAVEAAGSSVNRRIASFTGLGQRLDVFG